MYRLSFILNKRDSDTPIIATVVEKWFSRIGSHNISKHQVVDAGDCYGPGFTIKHIDG